jgi:hypothetical protein
VLVCIERSTGHPQKYYFDKEWNLLRYNKAGLNAPKDFTLPKPLNVNEMFDIASKLSKGLRFVRVDLYDVDGKIYFGEMTFFPMGGYDANRMPVAERRWGDLIVLE